MITYDLIEYYRKKVFPEFLNSAQKINNDDFWDYIIRGKSDSLYKRHNLSDSTRCKDILLLKLNNQWYFTTFLNFKDLVLIYYRINIRSLKSSYNSFNKEDVSDQLEEARILTQKESNAFFSIFFELPKIKEIYKDKIKKEKVVFNIIPDSNGFLPQLDKKYEHFKAYKFINRYNKFRERLGSVIGELSIHFETDFEIINTRVKEENSLFKSYSVKIQYENLRIFLDPIYITDDIDPTDRIFSQGWNFILGFSKISSCVRFKISKVIFDLPEQNGNSHPHMPNLNCIELAKSGTEDYCTNGRNTLSIPKSDTLEFLRGSRDLENADMIITNFIYQMIGYLKQQSVSGVPYFSLSSMRLNSVYRSITSVSEASIQFTYSQIRQNQINYFNSILKGFDSVGENIFSDKYVIRNYSVITGIKNTAILNLLKKLDNKKEFCFKTIKYYDRTVSSVGTSISLTLNSEILAREVRSRSINLTHGELEKLVCKIDKQLSESKKIYLNSFICLKDSVIIPYNYNDLVSRKEQLDLIFSDAEDKLYLSEKLILKSFINYLNLLEKCQKRNMKVTLKNLT